MGILKDQIKFNTKIGNIYIFGKLSFLKHFKSEVCRYTKKIYLNKNVSFNDNDIIFSINNSKIFDKKKLKKGIFINYHDSYLPAFKGLNSSTWSILKKKKTHGCTFHIMDESIDTGPIIYQKKITIPTNYNSHQVDLKNIFNGFELFKKILRDLFIKKVINFKYQKKTGKYFSKKDLLKIPLLGFIDLKWNKEKIIRHFNALKVSNFKKNFILNPKLLTKNYQILEIVNITVIKDNKSKNMTKLHKIKKKKFFLKKSKNLLEIEINKDLNKLEILGSKEIENYLKKKNINL
jgi:methionyl-tRNA formyltransferase